MAHAIVEVAKALGGSFKLVMLTPKTVKEMTRLPREIQKDGDTQTNQRNINEYTKYKPSQLYLMHTLQHVTLMSFTLTTIMVFRV